MARPNLMELTEAIGDSALLELLTTEQTLIPDPRTALASVPAGHLIQVDAIFVANKSLTLPGYVTVKHYIGGSPDRVVYLANRRLIAIRRMENVLNGKPLYVGEEEWVTISALANDILDADSPYIDMTNL